MTDREHLILIPGLVLNAAVWQAQIEALRDIADCWVAPLPPYDDLGAIAEDIIAEAPDRFAVAGVSMGGYLCFEILKRVPERVTRLALIATSAEPESSDVTERRLNMIRRVEHCGHLQTWREYYPRFLHTDGYNDPKVVDLLLKQAFEVGWKSCRRHHFAMIKRSGYYDVLPRITCPTLIVSGRQDPATPPAVQEKMARAIANSELLVIERCGHLPPIETPMAVSAAMRDWLARVPASVAA